MRPYRLIFYFLSVTLTGYSTQRGASFFRYFQDVSIWCAYLLKQGIDPYQYDLTKTQDIFNSAILQSVPRTASKHLARLESQIP